MVDSAPDGAASSQDGYSRLDHGLDLLDQGRAVEAAAELRRAVLADREPSMDRGELTPSAKVVRKVVVESFRELIEAMFQGGGGVIECPAWIIAERIERVGAKPKPACLNQEPDFEHTRRGRN